MAYPFDLDSSYRRFGEAIYRRARRILQDDAAASDAMQECFLRAHRYHKSYAGGPMLPWLFTICDRVCFDALKKYKKQSLSTDCSALIDAGADNAFVERPTSAEARLERDQLVAVALRGIDNETRQILIHRYFDELDTPAIAQTLGTSERTIRRRLEQFFVAARRRVERKNPSLTRKERA